MVSCSECACFVQLLSLPPTRCFHALVGFKIGKRETQVTCSHSKSTCLVGEEYPSFIKWNSSPRSDSFLNQNLSGLDEVVVTLLSLKINLKVIREGFS